jgi:outer membrane protein OmpA-like peptidoglycan-associated protein
MKKWIAYLLLVFPAVSGLRAQTVQWASRVIGFSSELTSLKTPRQYGALQILGKPNKLPVTGNSPCAWSPASEASPGEEWIKVGYRTPVKIKQIGVAENYNAGAITKIFAYDPQDKEYLVYTNQKDTTHVNGRMLNIYLKETPYKVAALKIVLNTSRIAGYNQLDAVGIGTTMDPIRPTINLIKDGPIQAKKENLGRTVNGAFDEICPVISPDGKTLYFTRAERPDNQDVWYAEIGTDGAFGTAKNMGPPVNTPLHNSSFSITPDGNMMLLNNVYKREGGMSKGLSMTRRVQNGWGFPDKVVINNYYNDNDYAEFSLAQNGKVLIMTAQRTESYGSKDLYVSFLQADGSWSEPRNMGPVVNTADAETSPFIASDGVSLYYSTAGLSGFGSNDIYVSRRLDDSWLNWSEPQNMGPGLNTDGWDAYFTIPASGEYAYFVSTKNSFGENDIFRARLSKEAQPEPVALVYGNVYDAQTKEALEAEIDYKVRETVAKTQGGGDKESGKASAIPSNGGYKVVLPLRKVYQLSAHVSGFSNAEESIDLSKDTVYREIRKDLYLVKLEVGQTVLLNNIFFEQSKFDLLEESFPELDRVATLLKANPTMEIQLEGHTDNQGDFMLNVELSRNRVMAVRDYLVKQGIDAARIHYKGYGSTRPVTSNHSEENRKKNRRVEFVIVKK